MQDEQGLLRIRDGASSVVLDTRYWPIVISTWFAEPTEPIVRKYFAENEKLIERAKKSREAYVVITDTFATSRPAPKVRKLIADLTEAQPAEAAALTAGSFIVIESALIRGVVTALRWVVPRLEQSIIVDGIVPAIARSLEALDARGTRRPKGFTPGDYRRPSA